MVSNQDRVAEQIFDLRFERLVASVLGPLSTTHRQFRVPTEEKLRSIAPPEPYTLNTLKDALEVSELTEEERRLYDIVFKLPRNDVLEYLETLVFSTLNQLMEFALRYHEEERAFWIFEGMLLHDDLDSDSVAGWLLRYPHLVFLLLHRYITSTTSHLTEPFDAIRQQVVEAVVLSANEAPIACLVALEKLRFDIAELSFQHYSSLLWTAAHVVRARQTSQEVLIVLDEQRRRAESTPEMEYAHVQAMKIAFERAEEAFENCPCDHNGRPVRQRVAPVRVQIHRKQPRSLSQAESGEKNIFDDPAIEDTHTPSLKQPLVVADIRIDKPSSARLHSHVRLTAASRPQKETLSYRRDILDGIVKLSFRGEVEIELFQYPPPEYEQMEWNLYDCGSTATTKAMMDALRHLHSDQEEACSFYRILTGASPDLIPEKEPIIETTGPEWHEFNESQKEAIAESCRTELSLIWGPPGRSSDINSIISHSLQGLGRLQ